MMETKTVLTILWTGKTIASPLQNASEEEEEEKWFYSLTGDVRSVCVCVSREPRNPYGFLYS